MKNSVENPRDAEGKPGPPSLDRGDIPRGDVKKSDGRGALLGRDGHGIYHGDPSVRGRGETERGGDGGGERGRGDERSRGDDRREEARAVQGSPGYQ